MTTREASLLIGATPADFMQHAACHGMSDLYDATVRDHPSPGQESVTPCEYAAIVICRNDCPVAADCLKWALDTKEPYGVWGATTAWQRAAIRRNNR